MAGPAHPVAIAIEDFGLARIGDLALEDDGQAIRRRKMQRLKKPGVENAEHRGVGAYAERQHRNNNESKGRTSPQNPRRIFKISDHWPEP